MNDVILWAAPVAAVGALAGIGYVSTKASSYFTAKAAKEVAAKQNADLDAALGRVTGGMGRIAGEIALDLAPSITPGMDLTVLKNAALADGVKRIGERFPGDVALLGAAPELLGSMLNGEVGKLIAPAVASVAVATPGTATFGEMKAAVSEEAAKAPTPAAPLPSAAAATLG